LRKVLIVDDSVSIRLTVSFTLRHGGYEVIEAENGHDAMNKLAAEMVDLIITDLNMPVMDGITLILKIRELPAMKSKPILMLTTEGLPSKKEQGKAAGATGWIVKPIDPERLLQTVAKVLP
jgi:two-component system chemotaxis response regulator CheY